MKSILTHGFRSQLISCGSVWCGDRRSQSNHCVHSDRLFSGEGSFLSHYAVFHSTADALVEAWWWLLCTRETSTNTCMMDIYSVFSLFLPLLSLPFVLYGIFLSVLYNLHPCPRAVFANRSALVSSCQTCFPQLFCSKKIVWSSHRPTVETNILQLWHISLCQLEAHK